MAENSDIEDYTYGHFCTFQEATKIPLDAKLYVEHEGRHIQLIGVRKILNGGSLVFGANPLSEHHERTIREGEYTNFSHAPAGERRGQEGL